MVSRKQSTAELALGQDYQIEFVSFQNLVEKPCLTTGESKEIGNHYELFIVEFDNGGTLQQCVYDPAAIIILAQINIKKPYTLGRGTADISPDGIGGISVAMSQRTVAEDIGPLRQGHIGLLKLDMIPGHILMDCIRWNTAFIHCYFDRSRGVTGGSDTAINTLFPQNIEKFSTIGVITDSTHHYTMAAKSCRMTGKICRRTSQLPALWQHVPQKLTYSHHNKTIIFSHLIPHQLAAPKRDLTMRRLDNKNTSTLNTLHFNGYPQPLLYQIYQNRNYSGAPHLVPFKPSRITQVCFKVPNESI